MGTKNVCSCILPRAKLVPGSGTHLEAMFPEPFLQLGEVSD